MKERRGHKRATEATKRTKYHWARMECERPNERDMPLYASYILYYNPIHRNAIVKKRQHLRYNTASQILLPHKENNGRQIVIFFYAIRSLLPPKYCCVVSSTLDSFLSPDGISRPVCSTVRLYDDVFNEIFLNFSLCTRLFQVIHHFFRLETRWFFCAGFR